MRRYREPKRFEVCAVMSTNEIAPILGDQFSCSTFDEALVALESLEECEWQSAQEVLVIVDHQLQLVSIGDDFTNSRSLRNYTLRY